MPQAGIYDPYTRAPLFDPEMFKLLSGEGRDEVPYCESDAWTAVRVETPRPTSAGADRADDRHLQAGAQQGEAGYATLCDSDEEESKERAGEADHESNVHGEEEVRPERHDRGA